MKYLMKYLALLFILFFVIAFASYLFAQDSNNENVANNNETENDSDGINETNEDNGAEISSEEEDFTPRTDLEEIERYLQLGDESFEEGFYDEAKIFYEEMKKFIKEDDYLNLAYYHNRIGKIYVKEENVVDAIKSYKKADKYFREKLNELFTNAKSIRIPQADNLIDLSIAYRIDGDFHTSLNILDDALLLYDAYGDKSGKAKAFISKANVLYYIEDYDKAEMYYMKALELYEEQDNYVSIGRIYNNLGAIYVNRENNDYETAIEFYQISIEFKLTTEDYEGAALSYRNVAVLYDMMDELGNSYEMMKRCVNIASEHNDKRLEEYQRYLAFLELRLNDDQ